MKKKYCKTCQVEIIKKSNNQRCKICTEVRDKEIKKNFFFHRTFDKYSLKQLKSFKAKFEDKITRLDTLIKEREKSI